MRRLSAPVFRLAAFVAVCLTLVGGVDLHLATENDRLRHGPLDRHELYRAAAGCADPISPHVDAADLHRLKDCPVCSRGLQNRGGSFELSEVSAQPISARIASAPAESALPVVARFPAPVRGPPTA
jgi:hypothetical protein